MREAIEAARRLIDGYSHKKRRADFEDDALTVARAILALPPGGEVGKPPIPERVYYSANSDNFYRAEDRRGMGMAFWTTWRARKDEFPTDQEAALRPEAAPQPTCSHCGAHGPCMVPSCPLKHLWPAAPQGGWNEAIEEAARKADYEAQSARLCMQGDVTGHEYMRVKDIVARAIAFEIRALKSPPESDPPGE